MKNHASITIFSLFMIVLISVCLFNVFNTNTYAASNQTSSLLSVVSITSADRSQIQHDNDKIEKAVCCNRVFDKLLYNDQALIKAATLVLKDDAHGGQIEKQKVNDFIYDLYGRRIKDDDGYYKVDSNLANYLCEIKDIQVLPDGKIEVQSSLITVYNEKEQKSVDCVTLLSKSTRSKFGYIILQAQIEKVSR